MPSLVVEARAKVNLRLEVGPARADGFHEVDTVMQSVSLSDRIVLRGVDGEGLAFTTDAAFDCPPEANLAVRAYEAYCRRLGRRPGAALHLEKRIPTQAGLGGGSADGAAVLRAMARLFPPEDAGRMPCADRIGAREGVRAEGELAADPFDAASATTEALLFDLAAELGSDCPFFLRGGTCRARGRGERLDLLPSPKDLHLLLLKPPEGMATARAYAMLDAHPRPTRPGTLDEWLPRLADGTPRQVARGLHDDFEAVVAAAVPAVAEGLAFLRDAGALNAIMSGSGTAVFGLFPDGAACHLAEARANTLFPSWGAWALRGEDRALVMRTV